MSATDNKARFSNIARFKIENIIKGNYYYSNVSNLTILLAEHDSPIVNGYFCFATKAFDDKGLPHTLEHLIFTGSKKYPYRGVLDLLANRCLAQGTNAWTSTDHTCYTLATASQDGFLKLLPVYMDHIFNPNFGEEEFTTEVYHLTPEGEHAGVVYSEMQQVQDTPSRVGFRTLMTNIFGNMSNYHYESGGKIENISKITLEEIKDYHKKFYKPENCIIIVVGPISREKLLDKISHIEETILKEHITCEKIPRPWINEVELTTYHGYDTVRYPGKKGNRDILASYKGPTIDKPIDKIAFNIVMSYLCCSNYSALRRVLIKCLQPLCNDLYYEIINFGTIFGNITFKGIKKPYIQDLIHGFTQVLFLMGSRDDGEGIDMELMKKTITREYLWVIDQFENNSHDKIASKAISVFLYGKNAMDYIIYADEINIYKKLLHQEEDFWIDFINKYFNKERLQIIEIKPSLKRLKASDAAKQEFLDNFKKNTTDEEKRKLQLAMDRAEAKSKIKPPLDILEDFPLPSVDEINFHHIQTLYNFGSFTFDSMSIYGFDLAQIPLSMQVDNISSNFLDVTLCVCLKNFKKDKLKYLPFVCYLPFDMPIIRNGVEMSSKSVSDRLELISLYYSGSIGYGGSTFFPGTLPQYFFLTIRTVIDYYEEAVSWLHDLFFGYTLDIENLIRYINEMIEIAGSDLERGSAVGYELSQVVAFKKHSFNNISSAIVQFPFLKSLKDKLINEPEKTIEILNEILKDLRSTTNINAHLACDFEKLSALHRYPHAIWQRSFLENSQYSSRTPLTPSHFNYDLMEDKIFSHKLIAFTSLKTSFFYQKMPGIRSYRHNDYPALLVIIQYLSGYEGPLSKAIRGKGLAYHVSMYIEPCDGIIGINIQNSVDIVRAYQEIINTIKNYSVGDKSIFTKDKLESAISGNIFCLVNEERTVANAGTQSFLAQLKGLSADFHKQLLKKISQVTTDDMARVGETYLSNLIISSKSHICVSCPEPQKDKVLEGFKNLGVDMSEYVISDVFKKLDDSGL